MNNKPNILVLCGKNKKRSRTAEYIFKNDDRFHVRSAGVSPKAERKVSENDLLWADIILVMETDHRKKLQDIYGHMELPKIIVLDIPDEYEFMDEELVDILTDKVNDVLSERFGM